jgi:ATP-dependent Lhr-like helicase
MLNGFGAATRHWFDHAFEAPTPVQRRGWERIAGGEHTLLIAPTGSGKTLAAFLWAIDRLSQGEGEGEGEAGGRGGGARVVYVSPLKALVYDIERNLRVPLRGIERAGASLGVPVRIPSIDVRTGDTTPDDRRRQLRQPGEVLVTTPESLFLLLNSQARETLRNVRWVIVDEIHAMAGTKRGAHLALSLERLSHLATDEPQRIGLSATVRPAEEIARFLGGDRPVRIVDAHVPPLLDLEVVVPVEDMTQPHLRTADGGVAAMAQGAASASAMPVEGEEATRQYGIWPVIYPRLLELIRAHRTTIVFVNSRGLCERLARHLNEQAGEELVRAHHGSLAHAQRREIEESLKAGTLRAIVATSSLELGIDMGAVDLVIMVESPGAVSRGLQRVGRAGHAVGEVSIGRIFPKHRGDLLEAAVVSRRMREGAIEALRVPRNPLDVLAQHVVAMAAVQPWPVTELGRVVRRAANFRELPESALVSVLDMLSGLYPSHDFADLRPRIRWDRERDVVEGRRSSRMLVAVNAGTIPDRGLFGVHLGPDGPRVGELDEEMVHESVAGQTFMLGATTWRIAEITRDRVIVEPAPGEPGRLPFWKGEGPGRPLELGRALGAFVRELERQGEGEGEEEGEGEGERKLREEYGLDGFAARNLLRYLEEQREATGAVPTDRDIVIERFRDELGDWRVCILTPFGARVHAPWALAVRAAVSARMGFEVQSVWSDDGIVLTLADGDEPPDLGLLLPAAEEIEERVVAELARSPLFASQFRENAARALLLPRRRPGARTPLFAQRRRAERLLSVAMQYPSFPIVIETYRSCLQDVFDLPALCEVLEGIERREIRIHEAETPAASPFARSLVFAYVAAYLYEGDSPAAERRVQALSLDMRLLRELLGEADLRELLDAGVLAEYEAELQRTAEGRRARDADELHDLLRQLGELDADELRARCAVDPEPLVQGLEHSRRAIPVRVRGRTAWIAIEDAGLYRDALGVALPPGIAAVFLGTVERPVEALLARFARTHGPFTTADVAARYGLVAAQAELLLAGLGADGRLLHGEFRPGASGPEWCGPDGLRQVKRRTIAKLRGQVAPVSRAVLARFLPAWHGITREHRHERLEDAIAQLEGLPLSCRELEKSILPARVRDFRPEHLDELGARGWLVWVGHSPLGPQDGRVVLYRRERVGRLLQPVTADETVVTLDERHRAVLAHLERRGASFVPDLAAGAGLAIPLLMDALRDLVWAGLVTNDTFAALRALTGRLPKASPARPVRASRWTSASLRSRSGQAAPSGGRWSLTRDLAAADVSPTERAHAWAATLLERHGIVSREAAALEGQRGGFSAIYRVLRSMEEAGKVRRGYFVEGLGGAQFAWPGVIDPLRRVREEEHEGDVVALSAVDPANPWGWLLPWPEYRDEAAHGARRVAGASVVLVDGEPVLYLDRGGRRLRTLRSASPEQVARAANALPELARRRPRRTLLIDLVDGAQATASGLAPLLRDLGFTREYLSLRLYAR